MLQQLAINSEILEQAVTISGIKNYNELVEQSIKLFISLTSQKRLKELRGKITWNGNLEELRELRNGND